MQTNFDTFPNRRASDSIKWHEYEEDVLPLWVADMDFLSPPAVIQALQERVNHGIFGYPQEPPELRQLIVARMAARYRWTIRPEEIVFLPGVIVGFNLACHTVAQPGGNVLIQTPVYPPILTTAKYAGMDRQENILVQKTDGSYEIDFDAFESAITAATRLFILCNPHNPVGRVFRPDELTRLAEICLRRGIPICSDEIHGDLVFPGHPHTPIASLSPEIAAQTITLMAPSKTFNIAGLECAFAIIPDESLRRRYRHAMQGLVSGVNLMGWIAATAAYRSSDEWLRELLITLEANRDFAVNFIQRELPGIKVAAPEGTFLAWLDCRETGLGPKPGEFFLKQARVALNDGEMFGTGGAGFVRLNFGCPRGILVDALERMKKAFNAR
jgi:cystathionine beta-lyase